VALANVLLLGLCMFAVFAIMGLNMFLGVFAFCNDPSTPTRESCSGSFSSAILDDTRGTDDWLGGVQQPRHWVTPDSNFNNFFASILTLFKIASLDGWTAIMYRGMDATQVDHQPVKNNASYNALFFVAFVFMGALFMFQLFISVVIST